MKPASNTQRFQVGTLYRIALLLAIIPALNGCVTGSAQSFDERQAVTEIEAALDGAARNRDGEIDRHVLLYIDAPTVDFTYKGAAGIARSDTQEPMTTDWQFFIASVAKSMTAVVIYQMAEEGAFGEQGIDATLAELNVLPPEVVEDLHRIDGVSYADAITLRHLLTHTSGLRDLFFDGVDNPVSLMPGTADGAAPDSLVGIVAFDEEYGLSPLVNCTLEGIPAGCNPDDYLFRHKWAAWDYAAWQADPNDRMAGLLNFYLAGMNENALWEPGEGFHYSDTNYTLLGLAIESVTGNSLHHELRTRIFDPLGMDDTYLVGATDPPTAPYEKQLADVWAWGEPSISGGVDFSFDWGGGGVVSTLDDLHTFARALMAGELFRRADTLDEMLAVPEGIKGISYASGLIVFPTAEGPVTYLMGSNGAWVEYYPPLDLVMVGTVDDFNNLPGQFMLHGEIYHILASNGLPTPMATTSSAPMLVYMVSLILLLLLLITWLIVALRGRRKGEALPGSIKWARWLAVGAFVANLIMTGLIGAAFGGNVFQTLFDFSPQVRKLFAATAYLMGAFTLAMAALAVQQWRRGEGKPLDRGIFTAITVVTLVYAISIGVLG